MKDTKNKMRQTPTNLAGKASNRGDSNGALSTITGKGTYALLNGRYDRCPPPLKK